MKYRKFVDNGKGDCIYCRERRHDCRCDEFTAKSLGYNYDCIIITKLLEQPPMPAGSTPLEALAFRLKHPTSQKAGIGIWRKGKTWFRSSIDLVDYHNSLDTEVDCEQ
ncbi:MAG: hypothetical protein HGA36_03975 [Candidatus Moranbacteria bacterium]|nr:hypothetical protein [Candidatus Moranbacteria bacterium]